MNVQAPRRILELLAFVTLLIASLGLGPNATGAGRSIVAVPATISRGASGEVRINLDSLGNENALGFSVIFDSGVLTFSNAAAGAAASAAIMNINESQKLNGNVGVMLALPAGQAFSAGTREVVRLTFSAAAGGGTQTTQIGFGDSPVVSEISDPSANVLGATCAGAVVTLQGGNDACAGPYDLFIPAAAHKSGLGGTRWLTDLDLVNTASGDAEVSIALLKENADNSQPLTRIFAVPAGRARRITDILGAEFFSTGAALGIRNCSGSVLANARFYNTASNCGGSYGMYIPGMIGARALDDSHVGIFHHLNYSTNPSRGSRVNIGFASASSFIVGVMISLFGDDGQPLGEPVTQELRPYEHRQITRIHERYNEEVTSGFARVKVTTQGGKVHPYAMLIENVSGDPIYMPVELQEDTDYPFNVMLDSGHK